MSRIRRTIVGLLVSMAVLGSGAGAVVAAVGTGAPSGVAAATAIEYGLAR